MKKLAVFVEGQTEQLFIERLIQEIAGQNDIVIDRRKLTGGGRSLPSLLRLWTSSSHPEPKYYILIFDCGGYTTVKSHVRDNYEKMVSNGYFSIICLRDVYPEFQYTEISKLRSGLKYGMRTNPIQVAFVLGVMEIETWFICEHTHFARMHPSLTPVHIKASLGYDPSVDDMQLRPIPSDDLDAIYRLVGRRYRKDYRHMMQLLDRLDYAYLYCEVLHRLPDLNLLVESISSFLADMPLPTPASAS